MPILPVETVKKNTRKNNNIQKYKGDKSIEGVYMELLGWHQEPPFIKTKLV